eukprot:279297-Chlamydomonas_euryale.AAC.2
MRGCGACLSSGPGCKDACLSTHPHACGTLTSMQHFHKHAARPQACGAPFSMRHNHKHVAHAAHACAVHAHALHARRCVHAPAWSV